MFRVLRLLLGTLLLLVCCVSNALEDPGSCSTIASDDARLSCYDRYFLDGADLENKKPLESAVSSTNAMDSIAPIEARDAQELALAQEEFGITSHHANYVLPLTYNFSADYSDFGPFEELFSDSEIKMQLSLKTRIIPNLWGDSSVWVAYTQQSYWQLYADSDASAPFRETNHQPEIMWQIPVNADVLGWNMSRATLAFNHQSNGRADPLSRSWNRITGEALFERGAFVASAKTWYRIEEDSENDNNPTIEDFMGQLELGLQYRRSGHTFAATLKNNLSSENRSGLELNWSFPLVEHLKGFVQIYSGYGENLIDMENYSNRIGIGVALTDWR